MTQADQKNRASQLLSAIEASRGKQVIESVNALEAMYGVFFRNRDELLNLVTAVEGASPPEVGNMWALGNREELGRLHREVARLLHNFLASAGSLIDHQRAMMRDIYSSHPMLKEYEDFIRQLIDANPVLAVIKGLRNWTLHQGLAPTRMAFEGSSNRSIQSKVLFSLSELNRYRKWTPEARDYLQAASSDPPVSGFVENYGRLVELIYTWIRDHIEQEEKSAIQELQRMQSELARVCGPVGNRE